jgi:hypothetical protein
MAETKKVGNGNDDDDDDDDDVNFALEQATKAQMGSCSIVLLFL